MDKYAEIFFISFEESRITGKVIVRYMNQLTRQIINESYLLMDVTECGFGLRTDFGMKSPDINLNEFSKIKDAVREINYHSIRENISFLLFLKSEETT